MFEKLGTKIGTKIGSSVLKKIGKTISEDLEYIFNKTSLNPFDADSLNKGEDDQFYQKEDENLETENQENINPINKDVSLWNKKDVEKVMFSKEYKSDRKVQNKVKNYFELNYPGYVKYDFSGRRIPSQR